MTNRMTVEEFKEVTGYDIELTHVPLSIAQGHHGEPGSVHQYAYAGYGFKVTNNTGA